MMALGALFFRFRRSSSRSFRDPWSLLTLRLVHGFATAIFSPVAAAYVASLGGRLSDGLGRKPVVVIGLLLGAAALPLMFRSESLATL